jgi:cell division protein FtsB
VSDPIKYPITVHHDGKSYIAHVELTPELARQILGDLPARVGALETQHAWLMQHAVVGGSDGRDAERPAQPQDKDQDEDEAQDIINRLYNNSGRYGDAARLANIIAALRAQVKKLEAKLAVTESERNSLGGEVAVLALTLDAERVDYRSQVAALKARVVTLEDALRKAAQLKTGMTYADFCTTLYEVHSAIRAAGIEVES